ncbi:hypothetical protein MGN70_007865 [Eutypa lata]|nr:hypothetical protein MGN70_007865 [Eutypa lata]
MAPVKRIVTTGGRGIQGAKGSISRVTKSSGNDKPKARKLMEKIAWYDEEKSSDIGRDFSEGKDLIGGVDIYAKLRSQLQLKEDVDIYAKLRSQLQLKEDPVAKEKSKKDDINLYDIPQWPGSALSEVQSLKVKERAEIRLEDIPLYQSRLVNGSNFPGMQTAAGGISPVVDGGECGLFDFPGLGGLDHPHPHIEYNDYNPYYYDLLVRKRELLLEMEQCMATQARLEAMGATSRLALARLGVVNGDSWRYE